MGVVDVVAGVFCGVDGDVKPRVGISHGHIIHKNLCTLSHIVSVTQTHTCTHAHIQCHAKYTLHACIPIINHP